jgi:hypothetical protein
MVSALTSCGTNSRYDGILGLRFVFIWLPLSIIRLFRLPYKLRDFFEDLQRPHRHPQGLLGLLQIALHLQHMHPRQRLLAPDLGYPLLQAAH